jgi:hypothetical protein
MNNKTQRRTKLKKKLAATFFEEIADLSPEIQAILLDDLVTAFENRLTFFKKLKNEEKPQFQIANTEPIEFIHD